MSESTEVTPSKDELLVEFAMLFQMTTDEVVVFLNSPQDFQEQMIANKRGENWTPPGPSTATRLLAILSLIANIAGDLSGIGTAISIIRAL